MALTRAELLARKAEQDKAAAEKARLAEQKKIEELRSRGATFKAKAQEREFAGATQEGAGQVSKITGRTELLQRDKLEKAEADRVAKAKAAAIQADLKQYAIVNGQCQLSPSGRYKGLQACIDAKDAQATKQKETDATEQESIQKELDEIAFAQKQSKKSETEATQADLQTTIERNIESLKASQAEASKVQAGQESAVQGATSFEPGTLQASANIAAGIGQLEGIKIRGVQLQREFDQSAQTIRASQRRLDAAIENDDVEAQKSALLERSAAIRAAQAIEERSKELGQEDSSRVFDFIDDLSEIDRNRFFSNLSTEGQASLQDKFDAAGFPPSTLGGLIQTANQIQEIDDQLLKDPQNEKLLNQRRVLTGQFSDIQNTAVDQKQTKDQERKEFLTELLNEGAITQEDFNKSIQKQIGLETQSEKAKRLEVEAKTRKLIDGKTTQRTDAQASGKIDSININGRDISLDSTALPSISDIDLLLKAEGIESGLIINDSFRSSEEQEKIIRRKAVEFGINQEGREINDIAEDVRKEGFQVANPGDSNHQSGMSIDVPAEIADNPLAVQIMKENGWVQLSDPTARARDRGHFNYVGVEEKIPTFKNMSQGNAFNFGARMLASGEIINEIEGDDFENDMEEYIHDLFGINIDPDNVPNVWKSDKEQIFDQARRDWVNANLRKESGAMISDTEFDSASLQYFAQMGDSKEVRENKRRNRELATNNLYLESGNHEFKKIHLKKIADDKVIQERFYDPLGIKPSTTEDPMGLFKETD